MRRIGAKHLAVVAATLLALLACILWLWTVATPDDDAPLTPVVVPTVAHAVSANARRPRTVEPTPPPAPEPDPTPPPEPPKVVAAPATLVVRVVDAISHAAVARATVSLADARGDERVHASDASGSIRFDSLPPGATEIEATAAGSLAAERTVVLAANAKETIEIALEPAVALDGVVVDAATRTPLAKAEVNVFKKSDTGERPIGKASTDKSGRFQFATLPPKAPVALKAWLPGYTRAIASLTLHAAGTAPPHVELALRRAGVLHGVVRLPDGRAAGGATVRVVAADGGADAWDGAFAESGADGTYVVRTVPVGVRLAVTAHERRWADSATEFVALPADGRDAARDLALRRPATLEVRVSAPDGYSPDVKVWVDEDRNSFGRSDFSDPKLPTIAKTVHENLAPGPHVVHVVPRFFPPMIRDIALAEGERAVVEIRLVEGVAIEGVLVDDFGTAVAGAAVFALPSDFEHPRRRVSGSAPHGTAGADGRFRIPGLALGSHDLYVLGAREYNLVSPEIAATRSGVDAPAKDVRIVTPRETQIVLRVVFAPEVTRPADIVVTQDLGDGDGISWDTARRPSLAIDVKAWTADGVVRCPFPPGASWLRVSVPAFAPERVRVPQWEFGRGVDLGEIAPQTGVSLRGRVIDSDGHAVAGATISTSADARGTPPVVARDDGSFVVDHLATGAVVVYAAAEKRFGSKYVTEAGDAGSVTIIARRMGVLRGVVVDAQGAPAKGARVTFTHRTVRSPGSSSNYETVWATPDDVVADDAGAFSVPVPFGPCTGHAGGPEFEANVPEGGSASVRVIAK